MGIDEFVGAERTSAFFALVAVCPLAAAFGAGSHYIAVCQEAVCLGIEKLFALLLYEDIVLVQFSEKLGGSLGMNLRARAGIDVETYSETAERVLYEFMVFVHYILRRTPLLSGLNGNRHAMLIRAAYIYNLLAFKAQVSDINVGRHIHSCKVPYVDTAVGVWQRRRNKMSFKNFLHRMLI